MPGGLTSDTAIDRYVIEHELGSGAFGTVYAARHRESGQRVALKRLNEMSSFALARFKREFRAVQGLHHPHIVRLDALFEHDSGWFIAMEYVEGCDLLEHLGGGPVDDEPLLREAFGQLADALGALHAHGVLHRDLKPANIRVSPEGRVVLLDFGLVTGVESDTQSTDGALAGTPHYMAPEQAGAGDLTEAADWYAFGVCLYEAFTGTVPFKGGSLLATLMAKQDQRPEPPSSRLGAAVPPDLESLCLALLDPVAAGRPGMSDVQRALGRDAAGADDLADSRELFEGREFELEALDAAHGAALAGGFRLLLVEGESGMGKSTLVAEWLRRLKRGTSYALVLHSRCYENEHTAFKAFDAGIEELARWFQTPDAARRLRPPAHAGLATKLFPALSSVPQLREASVLDAPADPSTALRRGLIALAELLNLAAKSAPVVLAIDDLQWADPDSLRLLRTLSESAHAPRVLVVATVRPRHELRDDVNAALERVREQAIVDVVPLRGLSSDASRRLASRLLDGGAIPKPRRSSARDSRPCDSWRFRCSTSMSPGPPPSTRRICADRSGSPTSSTRRERWPRRR